jgi:hypothetical protein
MTFTYSVQWAQNRPDEVQTKGEVTLETAIDYFQQFPWTEQAEIVVQRTNDSITSTPPTLIFTNAKNEHLAIYPANGNGFHVSYETATHFSDIYISNDFTKNPEGNTVEALIEYFFNDCIASTLILSEKPTENFEEMPFKSYLFNSQSTKKTKYLWPLVLSIGLLVVFLYFLVDYSVYHGTIIGNGFYLLATPFIISLPTIFLYIHYFLADKYKTLEINTRSEQIIITDRKKTVHIHRKDIQECTVIFVANRRLFWSDFQYLRIKINDTTSFIITCLIADPEEIIGLLKVNYKKTNVFLPVLSKGTLTEKEMVQRKERFQKQKDEFLKVFGSYETGRLQSIADNPDQYAEYAIAAAKELLQKRDHSK